MAWASATPDASRSPLAIRKQGPSTVRAMPMVDGVSRPSGMAVTFGFFVLWASR